jgi:hypothetical protein
MLTFFLIFLKISEYVLTQKFISTLASNKALNISACLAIAQSSQSKGLSI